ncbi:MAG: branched-chain amino acid ABC transporter permease [Hyphomicrobiales bacterium]|nr:branched-chain amino acid ABC transporter permease [Acidobacteriaceae bacterium]MBV9755045.1 branched-chain amino acid ABC transporter permease [Hyphomicrobiales bacterium]
MDQLTNFAVYMIAITSISFILAISLDLQVGNCGIVNFGQVVFLVVGAYATAIAIAAGTGVATAILIAVVSGALFGILMSLSVRNMSGTYWGILSLSMAEIVRIVALNEQWLTGGANGISVLISVPGLPWIIAASAVAAFGLVRLLIASPFGRTIRLIREGDRLPLSLGKNVLLFKMETMAIGGAIGGLTGAYYALMQRYMSPDDAKPIETFVIWAMVIVGGRGNVWGIVLGTVVIQAFYTGTRFLTGLFGIEADTMAALRLVVIGLLIMVVSMFRPQGLLPERRRIY